MTSHARRTVAVFVGKYAGPSTVEHVEAIANERPDWQFAVFQEFPPRRWRRYLRAKLRRIAREPGRYPAAVARRLVGRAFAGRSSPGEGPALAADLAALAATLPNVVYERCRSLHAPETLERIRAAQPWLGLALAAPILRRTLFAIPHRGTINLHKSLLPDYRGMPPGFWEIHDCADWSGVSVHWINDGLDTGAIIDQEPLAIPQFTTPAGLAVLLDRLGTLVLRRALAALDAGTAGEKRQGPSSIPTRSTPAARVAAVVAARCRRARLKSGGRLRATIKRAVLTGYVHGWIPVRNLARRMRGRAHTSVLLFHRVNDEFLDAVTVGVEQFRDQIALLQRHYDVVDMPTFLALRGQPCRRPRVVITFDDGYADNLIAAMLLRRSGVPATFFISTGIVGTDRGFPHDLERLRRVVPALRWDDVREMARWGYHFGNHTVSHVNLGAVSIDCAIREVAAAASDLDAAGVGGTAARWLAYPYGRATDISAELVERLPHLGITHCFSAFGGSNPPDFDTLAIRRQGVDCSMDLLRLRAAVEGWIS